MARLTPNVPARLFVKKSIIGRGVDLPEEVGAPLRARTEPVKPDGMSMVA